MSAEVAVVAVGRVPREVLAEGRARIAAAAQGANALVEALKVRLSATGSGVLAQVNAEVDGRRVRVQETSQGFAKAVDRIGEQLRRRIAAVNGTWKPQPWPQPGPPAELAGAVASSRDRQITRVKSPSLVWCSPEAAVRTLDAMDYDIHLFIDPATETDAVVYRTGPTGYRLARTTAAPPSRCAVPLTLSPHGARRLSAEQAVARLEAADLPFLFYAAPDSGRGRVLYRRYDGHLGLIAGRS
ncbi:sigma 54 modulation/S30EA ribosomal C-terminal domain-containing protein [Kitasatospora sp. NPDC101155]|uniref:sigma 54 modulation/S30EA ribosomal C-terminal domain-containing protein n=1 Tax=Kitasatospora sp. NPDC101155 TaxID=3364097 RepID=UPI0038257180